MVAQDLPRKGASIQVSSPAEQVLAHAQAGREVIQEFVPLAESLEWVLGQQYLRERGNKAFISDASPIPFVINNNGTLSRNAAEIFYASLVEAEKDGTLEDDIFVLELGIGVGLFARFFLDHFKDLCLKHRQDYYDRLCYVAADKSERMLLDVLRHGVLANHPGHYCIRVVDAMKPGAALPGTRVCGTFTASLFGRCSSIIFWIASLRPCWNSTASRSSSCACGRAWRATVKLSDHTDLTVKQLQDRAKSSDPQALQELLEVYGLFASEYDYRPVKIAKVPHGEFAYEFGRKQGKRLLVSYGAIQCLTQLLEMIPDQGFVLVNEYGHARLERTEDFEHQRFLTRRPWASTSRCCGSSLASPANASGLSRPATRSAASIRD